MTGVLMLYTGAFLLYGAMEVLGLMPQELVSAGFTLPRLFAKYLGDPVSTCLYVVLLLCTNYTHLLNRTSHFAGSGFLDVPSETYHNHNLCSSLLATDLLHRNVYG